MSEHARDAVKASPVVAVVSSWLAGISIEQWVQVATLIYVICLAVEKLYKGYLWLKARRAA